MKKPTKFPTNTVIKVDISAGNPCEGFYSIYPKPLDAADAAHFLETKDWKIPDESVTLLMAGHIVEHINPANKGFIKFMDKCWKALKVGGQMMISTPYGSSTGFYADPTHLNPCNAQTWYYFDPTNVTGLYTTYKPKPWKVDRCFFQSDGMMETLLVKLPDEKK